MADGGFVVKSNGKELCRCFAVSFDYDEWNYAVNDTETKDLPSETEKIAIEVE